MLTERKKEPEVGACPVTSIASDQNKKGAISMDLEEFLNPVGKALSEAPLSLNVSHNNQLEVLFDDEKVNQKPFAPSPETKPRGIVSEEKREKTEACCVIF